MNRKQAITFWTIGVASSLVAASLVLFYLRIFWSPEFSDNIQVWGAFGDYFGGTASAIFSLLSLLAILATTSIQIDIANKKSDAAHNEIKAQSIAATNSSKLQAVNFLYEFYSREILDLKKNNPKTGTRMSDRLSEVEIKIDSIKSMADEVYTKIMDQKNNKEN